MSESMKVLDVGQWDTSLAHVIDDMNGSPLNVHALIANHPPLLQAWWQFRNYIVNGGSLGQRNAELVTLRTAVHAQCEYEWASHIVRGMASGLSLAEIERVKAGPGESAWPETDALLLRAVDELTADGAIRAETLGELARVLGNEAVLDLIAIRATYSMLGNLLNTFDVPLDEHVLQALPKDAPTI